MEKGYLKGHELTMSEMGLCLEEMNGQPNMILRGLPRSQLCRNELTTVTKIAKNALVIPLEFKIQG